MISASPSRSTAVYVSVACAAIARLAGSVHGVVVQMTNDAGLPWSALASAGEAAFTGKRT
jgi:hypothetical protein